MTKLNFKISELIYSKTAKANNIKNMPDLKELDNLLNLIFFCLQPIRNIIKKPIIITSGYRCKELNKLIKGANNSQHIKGQAADFYVKNHSVNEIIQIIKENNLEFDQLINEKNQWVHISYNKDKNRKQLIYK